MQNQEKENQMGHSRTIKFRAWDKNENKMLGPFPVAPSKETVGTKYMPFYWQRDSEDMDWPTNLELMQYTGLKDKNGKEIYEGDIVKYVYILDGNDNTKVEQVIFTRGKFTTRPDECECINSIAEENVEIIGNIYENPSLLPN